MGMLKRRQISSGRSPLLHGLDFSHVEVQNAAFVAAPGTTIKFLGGATMGYNHATYGGIRLVCSAMSSGDSSRGLAMILTPTLATGGIRQGGLYIEMDRYTVMTASDGNYDIACKIYSRNRAASSAYARTRAMEILTEVRDTGSGNYAIDGIYVAVKTRSGTTLGAGGAIALKAETNIGSSSAGATVIAVNCNDVTQATNCAAIYGIDITTGAYAITRTAAIRIGNSGGVWTSGLYFQGTVTYPFTFDEADGSQGFTAGVALTPGGNCDGYFTVRDIVTGQTLYVRLYDAAPA